MLSTVWVAAAALGAVAQATSLASVCTSSYVKNSLPSNDFYTGITIDTSSVEANPVYNTNVSGQYFFPNAVFNYCNVTFAYSHNGRNDKVQLTYWLPEPDSFQNRYLSTGGGGYAISSGTGSMSSLPGGIIYGAVAGTTDGGFGGLSADTVFLLANGTINYETLFMFGYSAIHELGALGKQFTKQFFNMSDTKLYSYYQGCSEGGREGWSQVQRFPDSFDGAVIGAPAIRFAHQQVQHSWANVVELNENYYPPPCEVNEIVTQTISACDPLDGKTDGVVARTDLCKLHFNITSLIGKPYYCAASSGGGGGPPKRSKRQFGPSSSSPAQNGTVSAKGVAVVQKILNGIKTTDGQQVYLSYQPSAALSDADTQYNSTTDSWELSINSMGGDFIERFDRLLDASTVPNINGWTGDTLRDFIYQGWQMYDDTLQTTWPDLTPYHNFGGKVLHFHGESDYSIPTASSVRYWNSVRDIMYPGMSYNASAAAVNEWYKLFLIPGATHCAPNTAEPNGPFPQTNLAVMIDWVEKGVAPDTLNATVLLGSNVGQNQQICAWPLRPLWVNNGTDMECVYNQASLNTWNWDLNAFKLPVY